MVKGKSLILDRMGLRVKFDSITFIVNIDWFDLIYCRFLFIKFILHLFDLLFCDKKLALLFFKLLREHVDFFL